MANIYKASFCSLHVRKSNKAAIALYRDTLGFEVAKVENKYCERLPRYFRQR
jgi:ribosomal protein S18 acetylase RimI-like enzyme